MSHSSSSVLASIALLMISSPCAPAQTAALVADGLQCEFRENPLGIDVPQPRLSWLVESAARGARQTAYQIIAASTPDLLAKDQADLWDSGQIKSDETVNVPYAGKPLASAARVFWKVRAWDGDGKPSVWSAPAAWTMGVLAEADWQGAKWIGAVASPVESSRAGRGYHAAECSSQNEEKWVQVDLGQSLPITAIRLHPMRHEGKDGFGFPVRFKVEASDDADFGQAKTIADQTGADFPNPGYKPVTLPAGPGSVQGRYVRVTATKLWMWNATKYPFALSQLEVTSGGRNAAVAKPVTAKDAAEYAGWSKASLTDGLGLIGKPDEPKFASALLRRDFTVKTGLRRATAFVCGLGYYDMTLNGGKVTDDLLTPGWSKYDKTCLYDTYDVTALLRAGHNAIGFCLGNGMYNVERTAGRYTKFSGTFGPQRAIAQVRMEYQDGTVEYLLTDEQWRAASGPITFTSVYGGEDYDARLEQRGWDLAGFDAAKWLPAVVTKGPGGALKGLSCAAPAVRAYDVFKPVTIKELRPGVAVYDFGQNAAQMPTITMHGPAGSTVTLRPAELVNGDGSVDPLSTGRGGAICSYTLAGNGSSESWSPKFFYSGYRYIQVECAAPAPMPESASVSGGNGTLPVVDALQSVAVHTSARPVGEFATSSDLFNRIYTLVRWAQLSNMVSVLTDCPHREKLGWLEQIHLNGPALRYNFDLNAFFNKTMNDMADSQRADGLVWTTAPNYAITDGGDFADSPEWGSALPLVAWQQYQFTGDPNLLRRYYDNMARYVAYLGHRAKDGIVSHGLSDWYDIAPGGPGVSKLTPKGVTATAFYYDDSMVQARAAKILGLTEDAAKYEALAADIRVRFNARFFNPETKQYATNSQCANSLPLVMGIAPPDQRAAILGNILSDLEKKGLTAGDIGYRYLLRALADGGKSDVIFKMNNQSDKPGYGMQLARGATSLTEAWDALRSSSQDHFMLGQINEWFFHDLAGIQPDPAEPGFQKIVIKPAIVEGLGFVKATYRSVHGKIASSWACNDAGNLTLDITVPANTSAVVHVPARDAAGVSEGGKPAPQSEGVKFLRMENGAAEFSVESGEYHFTSRR